MEFLGRPVAPGLAGGPIVHAVAGSRGGKAPARTGVLVASRWTDVAPAPEGILPIAFILEEDEPPGSVRGGEPVVGGLSPDLFRDGELADVDGSSGRVRVAGLTEVQVVTAFLERDDGRVLLLRRSEKVGSFRGQWAAVSGFLEDPTPEQQALREVREETGIRPESLTVRAAAGPVYARDGGTVYTVHPFRMATRTAEVVLDWEHTESAWVDPAEIARRSTVPNLDRAWRAVAPGRVRKG